MSDYDHTSMQSDQPVVDNDSTKNKLNHFMWSALDYNARKTYHAQNPHGVAMAQEFDEDRCCLIDLLVLMTPEPTPQTNRLTYSTNKCSKEFPRKGYWAHKRRSRARQSITSVTRRRSKLAFERRNALYSGEAGSIKAEEHVQHGGDEACAE